MACASGLRPFGSLPSAQGRTLPEGVRRSKTGIPRQQRGQLVKPRDADEFGPAAQSQAVQPDAGQARFDRSAGVGVRLVTDVRDLLRRQAELLADGVEGGRFGLGDAEFGRTDDGLEAVADAEDAELAVLVVQRGVGQDGVPVAVGEGVEGRDRAGEQAPRRLVVRRR